jgi:hypothetical protein
MARSKAWRVTVDGKRYQALEASAVLDDHGSGGFNHPSLWLKFGRVESDGSVASDGYGDRRRVTVQIRYQRDLFRSDDTYFRPAEGRMDTRLRWSTCYAGRIALDDGASVHMDQEYTLGTEDRLRIKVASLIRATIREYNISAVYHDEFQAAAAAVEKLGCGVAWEYRSRSLGGLVPLGSIEERYANERAAKDAARAAVPSSDAEVA